MGGPGSCLAGPRWESGGWLETGSILLRRSLQKSYGIYDTLFCGLLQKFWKQHRENVQKPSTGDGRVCVQSLICSLRMQSLTIMPGPLPRDGTAATGYVGVPAKPKPCIPSLHVDFSSLPHTLPWTLKCRFLELGRGSECQGVSHQP